MFSCKDGPGKSIRSFITHILRPAQPMMLKLRDKAHAAYAPYRNGQHPASLASKKNLSVDHDDDELKILGGKTNVVAVSTQATLPLPPSGSQKTSGIHYPGSPAMLMQLPPTNHLDSVHPSLVQYLAQSPTPRVHGVSLPVQQPMVGPTYCLMIYFTTDVTFC